MERTRKAELTLQYLGGMKKLFAKELEYMEVIWQHPEGISSNEIYSYFTQSQSTKSTILFNISEKGYVVQRQEGRHHIYTAKVSKIEYNQALIKQKINIVGIDSLENLIAAFCGKNKATEEQKKKIEDFLEDLKNDGE